MGSSYGNVTLLGTSIDAVLGAAPRPAFVVADGDAVVVFAEVDDQGALTSGAALSAALGCVAVSAGVHDDDIFFVEVHVAGRAVASAAVPDPAAYFDLGSDVLAELAALDPEMLAAAGIDADALTGPPAGAFDADAVVQALGRGNPSAVRAALDADVVFATERHAAVVEGLGLSRAAVGWGHRYLVHDRGRYGGPPLTEV